MHACSRSMPAAGHMARLQPPMCGASSQQRRAACMTMTPLRHAMCAHHAGAVPGVGLLLARLPVRMRDVRELDTLIRPLAIGPPSPASQRFGCCSTRGPWSSVIGS